MLWAVRIFTPWGVEWLLWKRSRKKERERVLAAQIPEAARTSNSFQLEEAMASHERAFGVKPRGVWPSEGAVSPEAADIIRKAGLEWFASDEGVLARSAGGARASWPKLVSPPSPLTSRVAGSVLIASLSRSQQHLRATHSRESSKISTWSRTMRGARSGSMASSGCSAIHEEVEWRFFSRQPKDPK